MAWRYKIIPLKTLSRLIGVVSRVHFPPWLLRRAVDWYSSRYNVNTGEMITPTEGFRTFNEFFTRRLKEGSRGMDTDRRAVVSPVDGRIDQFGPIESSTMMQAKGIRYPVRDLIPSEAAAAFNNGDFITLYLSPGDYHRIHSPVDGTITGYMHVPGRLLSVRESVARNVPGLYTGNERVITFIRSKRGMVAVCKVGAANVGAISLSFDAAASKSFSHSLKEVIYPAAKEKTMRRGDELGVFNLGSTVIIIFEKGIVRFTIKSTGLKIKMGQQIAVWE